MNKKQKQLDEMIEKCCDTPFNELVIIRQNNAIIQLLFEIKSEIQKFKKTNGNK